MIGTHIGRYRIEGELGRGGMGVVYRGTQVTLDRTVAVKMLPARLADGEMRDRFRREALTLARLAHPNIIHIYDVEEVDGDSFIMMEYVGGGSLADLLASEGPLSPARAVEILGPILSALHAAHLAGIVHRDIKPDNILFSDSGRPKLTDFGIAHMRDGGSRTRTGVMLGTPYYMSPEQAQGRRVTATADIYAVGVVLYEMLTGRVPFTGRDPVSVALKHVQQPAPVLGEERDDLPPALSDVVDRALRKTPSARFPSAAAMQDALESALGYAARTGPAVADAGASGGYVADETRPWADSAPDSPTAAHVAASAPDSDPGQPSPVGSGSSTPVAEASDSHEGGTPESSLDVESPWSSTEGGTKGSDVARVVAMRGTTAAVATGRQVVAWFRRPGWAGYPMAFWTGAALLGATLLYAGAGALAGDPRPSDGRAPTAQSDPGPNGAGARLRTVFPTEAQQPTPATPLTPEERASLARILAGEDPSPGAETSSDSRSSSEVAGPADDGPTVDMRRIENTGYAEPEARARVEALVDRQIQSVETGDRDLFLQDFHPEVRDDAADEFDEAYAGVVEIQSTPSNLEIDFPEPGLAFVTFDVAVRFVVRADGRTETAASQEAWVLEWVGDRWWIVEWN